MGPKTVSIIITTRNREKDLQECLESLFQSRYKYFEIIVVDNGSTDQTVETINKRYPQIQIIPLKHNIKV